MMQIRRTGTDIENRLTNFFAAFEPGATTESVSKCPLHP